MENQQYREKQDVFDVIEDLLLEVKYNVAMSRQSLQDAHRKLGKVIRKIAPRSKRKR